MIRATLHDDLSARRRTAREVQLMVRWTTRRPLSFGPPPMVTTVGTGFFARLISAFVAMLFLTSRAGQAQVLAPEEIRDLQLRALQQKYRKELRLITGVAAVHPFPYKFYFSRNLDLNEKEQEQSDQRSVQFDRYQDRVVLKITGNYFASYAAELLKPEERARQTYESVMLPLLRAAVEALDKADVPQAFAFEVSHHVRKKILGVPSEVVENVVLVLGKESAKRLVTSADPRIRYAALLEGDAYLNGSPIYFRPRLEENSVEAATPPQVPPTHVGPSPSAAPAAIGSLLPRQGIAAPDVDRNVPSERLEQSPPVRDSSPEAIKDLQMAYQPVLDRLVQELESQAHFVSYAPPAFVPFHNGVYLQVSVTTALPQSQAGSRYRQAALAFDQHVAHLIRPVLAYFKGQRCEFDGMDFSATVRFASGQDASGSPLAVEFISPLKLLSSYTEFDSTGQQLIDGSFVLINGERVSLNLQAAETGLTAQ